MEKETNIDQHIIHINNSNEIDEKKHHRRRSSIGLRSSSIGRRSISKRDLGGVDVRIKASEIFSIATAQDSHQHNPSNVVVNLSHELENAIVKVEKVLTDDVDDLKNLTDQLIQINKIKRQIREKTDVIVNHINQIMNDGHKMRHKYKNQTIYIFCPKENDVEIDIGYQYKLNDISQDLENEQIRRSVVEKLKENYIECAIKIVSSHKISVESHQSHQGYISSYLIECKQTKHLKSQKNNPCCIIS
jgi:hypothetical protein